MRTDSQAVRRSRLASALLASAVAVALALCGLAQAQRVATGVAQVLNGFVVAVTVTDGGSGYAEPPTVALTGGGGSGATATALVAGGAVSQIIMLTAGSGYTSPPDVIISAPPGRGTLLQIQMVPLLTIVGSRGDTNRIEYVNAFGDTNAWLPLTNVVSGESPYEFYDRLSPPGAKRFYRAVLVGSCELPNVPGFVWVPPGTFTMGSPASEQGRSSDEGPQTVVTLTKGFFMCQHEVTQAEYLAVMGKNPAYFTGDTNRPVEQVRESDAISYCGNLTVAERTAGRLPPGWVYRLPTEAEWEYACRAGTTTRFYYGDDPGYGQLGSYAWYGPNSGSKTHPVAQRLPNPWGLYDMAGNVWEWCLDIYGSYPGGSVTNPTGGRLGPSLAPSYYITRGGGLGSSGNSCRSARRSSQSLPDRYTGFRVALDPSQP